MIVFFYHSQKKGWKNGAKMRNEQKVCDIKSELKEETNGKAEGFISFVEIGND